MIEKYCKIRGNGHVIPNMSLTRRLLYGELSQGQRSAGGPKKRFSDHIRVTLQKCNIQLSELEASARDRDVGRTVCEAGLGDFMNDWASISMKRRAARHAAKAKPTAGPCCPHCSRVCALEFGLQSSSDPHSSSLG